MRVPALTFALTCLLCLAPARADETWDLRKLDHKAAAGDKVRTETSEKQQMKFVVQQGAETVRKDEKVEGFAGAWTDEVQAVDEEGQPTKSRRTYESYEDHESGKKVEVAGIVVLLERDAAGKHGFKAEGDKPLPPELQARLEAEVKKDDEKLAAKKAGKEAESDKMDRLLPEKPVGVGAEWEVPAQAAADAFELNGSELDPKSKVTGKLVAAEARGGATYLKIELTIDLWLKTFQEMACPEPASFRFKVHMNVPADGKAPDGELSMTGSFNAAPQNPEAPPGMTMTIDLAVENKTKRTRS